MRQQCPKCGKGFDSGRGLRMHLREKHYGYYFTRFTATWLVVGAGVKVPSNIGITPDGRMRVIHTHDETGVIHVESPRYAEFTFGDFLKIWVKSLNSTCFDRYCGKIRFTANGVEVIDPLNYVLMDRDELVLEVITKPS